MSEVIERSQVKTDKSVTLRRVKYIGVLRTVAGLLLIVNGILKLTVLNTGTDSISMLMVPLGIFIAIKGIWDLKNFFLKMDNDQIELRLTMMAKRKFNKSDIAEIGKKGNRLLVKLKSGKLHIIPINLCLKEDRETLLELFRP